jgi:hypothetical protein
VGRWLDRSGNNDHLVGVDNLPTYTQTPAAGVLYGSGGAEHLELVSPVALTGTCTLYAWGNRGTGPLDWQPIRGASATFSLHSGGNVFVVADDGSQVFAPYTGTGRKLFRWRRASNGHWYFAATGFSEVDLDVLSGTVTLTRQIGIISGTVEGLIVATADCVAGGWAADAEAYIATAGGPGL